MKKLREYLIKWTDGQKVRGINVTPYDVEECIRVYNAIVRKEKPEFINGKVKEILDKCKIKFICIQPIIKSQVEFLICTFNVHEKIYPLTFI